MWRQRETSSRTWGVFQREEAFLRAQREAERKRQERELLHIQEEQERLQRKKVPEIHSSHSQGSESILDCRATLRGLLWFPQRIEEIMKRTRKSEAEPLPTAAGSSSPMMSFPAGSA